MTDSIDFEDIEVDSSPRYQDGMCSVAGVPHRGWINVGIKDLGENADNWQTCVWCGWKLIRWVHYETHPDSPGMEPLEVGSHCCVGMEEDKAAPILREKKMRNRASRRANFLATDKWFQKANGTWALKWHGQRARVFKTRYGNFGAGILHGYGTEPTWIKGYFGTVAQAMEALFDVLDPA